MVVVVEGGAAKVDETEVSRGGYFDGHVGEDVSAGGTGKGV